MANPVIKLRPVQDGGRFVEVAGFGFTPGGMVKLGYDVSTAGAPATHTEGEETLRCDDAGNIAFRIPVHLAGDIAHVDVQARDLATDKVAEAALPEEVPLTARPGSPMALAAQRNGDLAAVVVRDDGVPHISWQRQGEPWHRFERIAAYDDRFPDGFTVPPGALLALAPQRNGDLAAVVVGRDGIPYVSWQRQNEPWHRFERIDVEHDGFRSTPGAPMAVAPQRNGDLAAAVVRDDGVPHISWQRQGEPWHRLERIAAYDDRFPDGFTVPPGAPIALAPQRNGDLAAVAVGRDGIPYISWQRQGEPWHRFERIDVDDDGFRAPPGAPMALAAQRNGDLAAVVVRDDGVPHISWQRQGEPWHPFVRIAAYDDRFHDGFTVPRGAPLALAPQRNGDLAAVVVGRDGNPYISWQRQNEPWHRFERIDVDDDGFRAPPGAPMALAAQRNGDLAAVVVRDDGVPHISWQRQGEPWHPFVRIAP